MMDTDTASGRASALLTAEFWCDVKSRISAQVAPQVSLADPFSLTRRKMELLQLLAQGYTAKGSARALNISHRTVEIHMQEIRRQFGAKTAAHAVAIALRNGVLS